jgi:PAS domain S-box-containing protein
LKTPFFPEAIDQEDPPPLERDLEFRALADAIPQLVWKGGPDGRNDYVNQRWTDFTGLSPQASRGHGWLTAFHAEDRPRVVGAWPPAAPPGAEPPLKCRLQASDGTYRWFLIRCVPWRDAEGAALGWFGTGTDIDEQQRTGEALRLSEEKFRQLTDHITDAFWIRSPDMQSVHLITAGYEKIWGRSIESLYADPHKWTDAIYPEDRDRVVAVYDRLMGQESQVSVEYRITRADGKLRWVHARGFQIRDAAGAVVRLAGIVTDITSRRLDEERLRQKDALIRIAGRITRTGGWAVELPDQRLFWSDELCDLLEYDRGSPPPIAEALTLYPEPGRTQIRAAIEACAQDGTIFDLEVQIQTRKGRRVWVRVFGEADRLADGSIIRVQGAFQDITERRLSEELLRASEERFRRYFELGLVGMAITSPTKALLEINDRVCDLLGYERQELLQKTWSEMTHPDDLAADNAQFSRVMAGKIEGYNIEKRFMRKDGQAVDMLLAVKCVRHPNGPVNYFVSLMQDISERRKSERHTELQHAVTRVLAEGAPLAQTARKLLETVCPAMGWTAGALWTVDRAVKVLRCAEFWPLPSAEFRRFAESSRWVTLGPGEGLPGKIWAMAQPVWIPEGEQDLAIRRRAEATGVVLGGTVGFPIKLRGEVLGAVEFFSAESRAPEPEVLALFAALGTQLGQFIEREQLADQFRQAQKMEAIGTLAGGIAHDFNNVLAAINGYTELAKCEITNNPTAIEYLDAVLNGGRRAADLVRQILTFSRRQQLERKPIQLRPVVVEAMKLLRATIPAAIEFEVTLASSVPNVLADASQIHQVVMNLCTNAAQAMAGKPGHLAVKLESMEVDAAIAAVHSGLQPGRYVRLSVGDTGSGMDSATLSRIYEPFFTTKAPGEGTGLGLAVVHGIMQSHDGIITADSRLAEGTVFNLYFPACASAAETVVLAAPAPRGQGQRILFVDDEAPLATLGRKTLERMGYAVDARTDAQEALAAVRATPDAYDLVVTDQMMPVLMGTGLAEQIHVIRPDLPILLITGYTATLTPERLRPLGIRELILKPVSVAALGAVVGRILATGKPRRLALRILLVDDDDSFRTMLRLTLANLGYVVREARDGREAVRLYEEAPPDIMMTDLVMPVQEGVVTIEIVRRRYPRAKIIAMSGGDRVSAADHLKRAQAMGADYLLAKPFSLDQLQRALGALLHNA